MAKKQQPGWQFKFTLGLSIVMFFLVIAYFFESFQKMLEIQPVQVAIERLSESPAEIPKTTTDPAEIIKQEKQDIAE